MPITINALEVIGKGFPPVEGANLADHLLANHPDALGEVTVDLRSLPASMLISAFFNGFLTRVRDVAPQRLDAARTVKWVLTFPFQRTNVEKWMREFKVVPGQSEASRT